MKQVSNTDNDTDNVLLIDDIRTADWIEAQYGMVPTSIARTYEDGVKKLMTMPEIDLLYIDHDLGEERSGYDLITWMLERGIRPMLVHIVSSNPVGRENIARALDNAGYVKRMGSWMDPC